MPKPMLRVRVRNWMTSMIDTSFAYNLAVRRFDKAHVYSAGDVIEYSDKILGDVIRGVITSVVSRTDGLNWYYVASISGDAHVVYSTDIMRRI